MNASQNFLANGSARSGAITPPAGFRPEDALLLAGPHVATLPDGTRLNLPAGTMLREGVEDRPSAAMVDPPWSQVAKNIRALLAEGMGAGDVLAMLLGTETPGLCPSPTARDLLQRARVPLTASEDDDAPALLAEIVAFLAGKAPEGSR